MNETTEQNPWTAKPHALKLGWVMTSQGLRMRWTVRPELVTSQSHEEEAAQQRPASEVRAA